MADRLHGRAGPQPSNTVRGEDWYGADLTGQVFEDIAYIDLDLSETTSTSGLTFVDCTFRQMRLNVSEHTGASFANCTFTDCRFFDTTFIECKFIGAMFDRCNTDRLTVRGGDWSFVGLPGADLRTATITDARMREADLTGARCEGAVLRSLDLSGAMLARANLDRCDLRGSDLSSLDPWTTSLRGAIVDPVGAMVLAAAMGIEVRAD